jgi:hypothetical protein
VPFFRRSSKLSDEIKLVIADAVKANMVPAAQSQGATASSLANEVRNALSPGQVTPGGIGQWFEELPRTDPMVPFSPGVAIPPAAIDPLNALGRTPPRTYDGPVSWNINLGPNREVPWLILRSAADVDIVRRCIEIRKADIVALEWDITIGDAAVADQMAKATDTKGKNRARATAAAHEQYQDIITALKRFWEMPDRMNNLDYPQWLNALLEEYLVTDAVTIYPHPALGACPVPGIPIPTHSMRQIDGSTIKPLYDHLYNLPGGGQPAYQQVMYGFPRGEYSYDLNARGEFLADQLVYKPRNRRIRSPYGLSPVEQALPRIDLWLKREEWIRAEFGVGANPNTWLKITEQAASGQNWSVQQRRMFEKDLNDELGGQTTSRHLLHVLPPGLEPAQMAEFAEKYKPDYDEHLLLTIASYFDVMGTQLNITPKGGLGGKGHQEGEDAKSQAQARRPTVEFLTGLLNHVSRQFLGMPDELTFIFRSTDEDDIGEVTTSRQTELFSGQTTLNGIQAEAGRPLFDFAEADMPFVVAQGVGLVWLEGASTKPAVVPAPFGQPPGAPGSGQAPGGPLPPKLAPGPGQSDKPDNDTNAEVQKFVAFTTNRVKQGKPWRNFTFTAVDPDTAADLNELGLSGDLVTLKAVAADLLKARAPWGRDKADAIEAHYGPKLATATKRAFKGLRQVVAAQVAQRKITRPVQKAANPSDVSAATGAISAGVVIERTQILAILGDLYGDAYLAGAAEGAASVGGGAVIAASIAEAVAEINWDDWVPGNPEAALKDATGGLRQLLEQSDIQIRSVIDSRLDELGNVLANGLDAGDGIGAITSALTDVLSNPANAEMIARTETARAMSDAALDTYKANDIRQVDLKTFAGCDVCEGIAEDNPYDIGSAPDMPIHPNCRCALLPVVDTGEASEQTGQEAA